jgi:peroxiredoxin
MYENVTFPIGNIVMLDRIQKDYGYFDFLFGKIGGKAKVDTVPSKKAWAKELVIENTRLLSDFWHHGDVARSYGIFREKEGFSERANIIVDVNGQVIFVKVYPISQLPDIEEINKVLEG